MPLVVKKYKEWVDGGHQGLKEIHNALEDIWMEPRVIDDYAGAEKNLRTLDEVVKQREIKGLTERLAKEPTYLDELNADKVCSGITTMGRAAYGGASRKILEGMLPEKLTAHSKVWAEQAQKQTDTAGVMKIAKAVYKLLEQDPNLDSKPEDFDPESGEEPDLDKEPTKEQKVEGQKGKGQREAEQKILSAMQQALEELIPGGMGCPQGDYVGSYRVLTTKYDKVYSIKNPDGEKAFTSNSVTKYNEDRTKVQGHVAVMKTKLRRALLSKQRRDWEFGRQLGKLDSKKLVAAYSGSQNVFKQRVDREEENTAIQILVDLSGSMYGSKVKLAQQCVIALAECFEGTSLQYQISGFDAKNMGHNSYKASKSGKSYHRLEANLIYNFKPFDLQLRQARPALGLITETGQANNADRDAIIWALNSLKLRDEKRKILLVLSDGNPANETINVGTKELTRHAKLAVEWGKKKGIECIGIGIMDDTVKQIYLDAVVVNDINELSGSVFRKFTELLLKGK